MAKKKDNPGKGKRVKKVLMTIAIAIILAFFVGYAVNTFYKEPKYEDFCKPRLYDVQLNTQAQCEAVGGNWSIIPEEKLDPSQVLATNQYLCTKQDTLNVNELILTCVTKEMQKQNGWCDPEYKCRKDYEKVLEPHNRNSFIILAIIGLIIIGVSTIKIKENVIGYGLLAGGILTLLYGTIRFWGAIPDYGRLTILGVVLVTLVIIAWKKLVKN
jgi:hypothetical protein